MVEIDDGQGLLVTWVCSVDNQP